MTRRKGLRQAQDRGKQMEAPMPAGIDTLASELQSRLDQMAPDDSRRLFCSVYRRTTLAVGEEIVRGGFIDGSWVDRWDLAFGVLYLRPLDSELRGEPVPAPWAVAFRQAREQPQLSPLRQVLVGINAHINYDLPQALLAVISDAELDDEELLGRRSADHSHVDDVLAAPV